MILPHHIPKLLGVGILVLAWSRLFAADLPTRSIQDDSALRRSIKDDWLTGAPAQAAQNRPFIHTLPGGGSVQVRSSSRGSAFTVILAREWNGAFGGTGQGSWIYTRNFNTGRPERIRVFLRSDPLAYVQFRPLGKDKSQMDVVIHEAYVVRGLALGIPFERLLTIPVEDALTAAGSRFPRRYFDPDPRFYREVRTLITRIREKLPGLAYGDDGAVDEGGSYVFIASLQAQAGSPGLNCSGFAKWVVDGMLRPVTGKRLAIPLLKTPVSSRTSIQENFEERDSLFGLDWTRNLALEAARTLRSPGFAVVENVEVRRESFAALIDRRGGNTAVKSYPGFLVNAGFSVEGLRPLLYTLAVNEPGWLYLGSVSQERGPRPVQRQYYHEAVFLPYFDETGAFRTAVFESAAETSLTGFIARHPGAMINLVRIPVEGAFDP
ncbi:MAG: hypothetical protein LBD31_11065 [Treponema sp.]|jgi:hypothetical protein|nr:hypothetical protein [Treponema sp.]